MSFAQNEPSGQHQSSPHGSRPLGHAFLMGMQAAYPPGGAPQPQYQFAAGAGQQTS